MWLALVIRRTAGLALGLAVCLATTTCSTSKPVATSRPLGFLLGGIQVNEPDHTQWVDTLKAVGMNTVAATVYAKQGDWDSSNLWYEDEEPAVIAEIRTAKRRGAKVVLVLRVALDHAFKRNRFLWHGMIMPRSDADLAEWFRRYEAFVDKWAAIAEREGVDMLAVGSEMSSLTNGRPATELPALEAFYLDAAKQQAYIDELLVFRDRIERVHLRAKGAAEHEDLQAFLTARRAANSTWAEAVSYFGSSDPLGKVNERRTRLAAGWRAVIQRARARFSRPLTYAANFDQYDQVAFWDRLDVIGINAYFRLRLDPNAEPKPLGDLLDAGWTHVLGAMQAFRRQHGLQNKPIVFTEMGYTFRRNSTVSPWESSGFSIEGQSSRTLMIWEAQPTDLDERAESVRSLRRVSQAIAPKMLAGILYWKLSTLAEHRIIEPFVLIVGLDTVDPLQSALLQFTR